MTTASETNESTISNTTSKTTESSDPRLEELRREAAKISQNIENNVSKRVVGQSHLLRSFMISLATGGHLLLEGVPGLAKTLAIKSLAESVSGKFQRIQFTPDLLPADIVGSEVYRPQDGGFETRKGPIFANFILADEINRAPAKVQSALLEVMAEKQVTIAGESLEVPTPFFVMATQNPIEQEGTYNLPEAQTDRFMMKVVISYPTAKEELEMLKKVTRSNAQSNDHGSPLDAVASTKDLEILKQASETIYVDDLLRKYIVSLVYATRTPPEQLASFIEYGSSPRATIALFEAARAQAMIEGEDFVRPQHVKDVARDVLQHRIGLSYQAEASNMGGAEIVEQLVELVEVP